jgi:hypothetical protein
LAAAHVNLRDCYRLLPHEIASPYEDLLASRRRPLLSPSDNHKKSAPPALLRAGLKKRAKPFT